MRKNSIHTLTMIVGVITALVIVFSQLFFFENNTYSKEEIKKGEEQKQNNSDEAYITPPSVSQPSSTHVEVNEKSSYLFEILLFEEGEEESELIDIPLSLGKYFHTLFRIIISPNAP